MPYESQAQARYIFAKAGEGEKWAKKWVSESHGQDVSRLPEKKGGKATWRKWHKRRMQDDEDID